MSFIRALYRGGLNPMEMEMTKTKEFRDAAKRVCEVSRQLQDALSKEQWELYESHEDARSKLREQAKFYKENYPKGTRIMLISMGEDVHRIPDHTRGTVKFVDDTGTLHCSFDNGHSPGIIPGEDSFRKLTDAELMEEQGVRNNDDEDNVMEMGR